MLDLLFFIVLYNGKGIAKIEAPGDLLNFPQPLRPFLWVSNM